MIQYYDNVKTRFRETWSNGVLCNGAPVPVGAAHRFGFYPDSPQNKSRFSGEDGLLGRTVSQSSDDSFGSTLATIALVDAISDFSSPSVDTSSSSDFSGGGGDFGGGGSSGSW